MELQPDTILDGKFRISRMIGAGAMGVVYEGEHLRIHRRVAIKVMQPEARKDSEALQRLEREAQALGLIGNDHVLEVFDLGALADGSPYVVMEYVDGESLADRFERVGRLSEAELHPIIRQVLLGLSGAHRARVIHRDLKPENILLISRAGAACDFVKVIDFGVSKLVSTGDAVARPNRLTQTGTILGTPYYMSPEQARGASLLTASSDLYAVGVVLYEGLTGHLPFEADSINGLLFNIATGRKRRPLSDFPHVHPAFVEVIERAIAFEPEARFQIADSFIEALDAAAARLSGAEQQVSSPRPTESHAPAAPPTPERRRPSTKHAWSALARAAISSRRNASLFTMLAASALTLAALAVRGSEQAERDGGTAANSSSRALAGTQRPSTGSRAAPIETQNLGQTIQQPLSVAPRAPHVADATALHAAESQLGAARSPDEPVTTDSAARANVVSRQASAAELKAAATRTMQTPTRGETGTTESRPNTATVASMNSPAASFPAPKSAPPTATTAARETSAAERAKTAPPPTKTPEPAALAPAKPATSSQPRAAPRQEAAHDSGRRRRVLEAGY